jgi:hypothetical protein
MKLNTVNVVVIFDGILHTVESFTDDADGNKEAEELLISKIRDEQVELDNEDIQVILNQGYFDMPYYDFYLIHSYGWIGDNYSVLKYL